MVIMRNLWEETIRDLATCGLTWDDVDNVCFARVYQITKDRFKELAEQTEYDADYGCAEIDLRLRLIGHKDGKMFVMYRYEYDGYEQWGIHTLDTEIPFTDVDTLINTWDFE